MPVNEHAIAAAIAGLKSGRFSSQRAAERAYGIFHSYTLVASRTELKTPKKKPRTLTTV